MAPDRTPPTPIKGLWLHRWKTLLCSCARSKSRLS